MNEEGIMERNKLQKRETFLAALIKAGILSVTVLLVAGLMATAFADQSISISCYKDPQSSSSVGTVVVYDVAVAARACNSMYYDCKGRCIGCYHDFDYLDNVCVDMQGNTFLK
jgi:hypothetical protein